MLRTVWRLASSTSAFFIKLTFICLRWIFQIIFHFGNERLAAARRRQSFWSTWNFRISCLRHCHQIELLLFCIKLIIFGLFCIFIFSWQSDSSADGFYFILISWNIIIAYAFVFPSDFPASLQHMKSWIWLNIKGAICPPSAIRSAAFAKIWKPAATQSLTDCWKWSCRWYTD